MKKRPASILLIVCLLLSLLPASVFAATEYDLYINEFRFTSTNLTYTGEVGSAVYSPQTKTLSLNNLTISTSRTNALIYSNIPGLTIDVNGTTTINLLDSSPIGGSDVGTDQTNHAFMLNAATTIKGQRGNKSIDKIVINSKSIGVTNPEPDGTTRVGISSASQLTLQDITLSMTDNSATNKVGYASLLRAGGYTTISGCTLDAQKCAHGVFMLEKAAANIAGTEFSMNLSGTLTSGMNFSPGTTNLVSNCSGTINATYPLYSQGSVTVSNAAGGKLTLNGTGAAAVAAENKGAAGGKLLFQDANVVLTSSDSYGIHLQPNASAELKRSTVDVTAPNICVYVDENAKLSLTDGSDQTCRLYLKGTNTAEGGSIGIYAKGSVSFDAGLLSISNVYTAIQNMRTGTVDFSGGNHTLNAAACGYLNNGTGKLKIGGNVNVTVNALIGIQLTKDTGGMLQMSDGTLNLNCGETGLRLQNGAGKTTLSGGRLNITGTGSTPAADGIMAYSAIEFSGTEVFFQHCKRDLISLNGANKLTAGKLSLSGSNMGAQLSGGFEMSGGELASDCANLGVVVTQGTAALKNGKLTLNAGYPLYLQSGGVLDFAGAEVKATATENCALYVDPNTADGASSYRITGGTVVLQSTQAAANAVYTSLPANYGVWVGADEASAAPVSTVTQPVLARNKYARFAEKQSYTLTLVNVKEGSSATVVGGDAITYTAADAPEGQHFSHWELTVGTSTTSVGTNATYTGTMPHSDATLTAVYEDCRGGTATCTARATCEVCGKPYGNLAAHSFTAETVKDEYLKSAADCDNAAVYYKSCTGCGATSKGTEVEATFEYGTALGHDWGEWKSNGNGTHTHTCSRNPEHTETKDCHGGTADCTHKAVCDDCHGEYGNTADHNYTAETVDEKYLKSAADCDHTAVYYKSCTGCGATSEGTTAEATFEFGTALGHDEVIDAEKAPTCTQTGLTEGKHCARCNKVLVAQTEIPALGHNVTEGTVTKQPTCTEDGEIVGTCSRCGETNVTAKVDKLPHTEEDVAAVPATCTESGRSAGKYCSVCGEYTEGHELLAPLGHTLRALPETDTLTEGQECSVCHEIVIPQLPKLSDRWTDDGNYDAELYASEPGNWVLCDAADLAAYAKKINDGGSFAGYTVTLANDIDLSGHIWTPIAPNYSSANVGTFDGAMHAIRGMYAESDRYAALFGNVTGSAVLNVTVYGDVRLVTSGYQTKNGNYAAGLIAYATRTVIRNCGFVGTVSMYAPEARFARELGGLTAYHSVGVVENCYAIATVYATGSNAAYAGGIAAELSSFNDGEWSELRGCYTACQFYVDASNVGALVGNTHWNVAFTDCYVQSAYTSGYSARLGGNGNLTYTTLPTEDMTDPDVLLAALNRYVAQDESRLCGAWLLDASVNGGYPFHGLSVWFTPNVEGAKSALRAVHPGTTVTAPTLDIAGYRCVGWYADADFEAEFDFTKPITANTVVYGKYLSNTYSVTYVLNGGENAAANPAEFLCGTGTALADPTRENYLFEGWYTDADFENKVTEIAADTAHDVTLYAKWTLDPNHPHVYGVCKVGSDGLHDHVCTLCGSTFDCEYTETVVAPTCKSAGYTVHTCRSCGNAYIDSVVEGSHKWSTSVVAPTHTEAGCTLYTCSVCGESYKSDYTAPLGHSWDDGKVTKPATCTENGELTHTCSCGETHTVPIPKTGHSWDGGKVVSAATLTETGKLIQTCTVCGATLETVIPLLTACDGSEGCPSTAYTDVPDAKNWAHVGIDFVLKAGLFYGTSDTAFSPDSGMTRAMLVTVLYRLEGQPKTSAKNPFTDVKTDLWYTDAVVWAAENGIVDGIGDGKFDPDGKITREQMATILYRYAAFKELTLTEGKFAADYPDERKVSTYALGAMRWANAEKLINGTQRGSTVYLDPQGSATRAQVAAILMRFVQNIL